MILSRSSVPLPSAVRRHLRLCRKCRRLRRRLGRLDETVATLPPPEDNPGARQRLLANLPPQPAGPLAKPQAPPPWWFRVTRVAAVFFLGLVLTSFMVLLVQRFPYSGTKERSGETPGTPEELMVVRFLERDLRLAETFTAVDQLPVLADMAGDLRSEIFRLTRQGQTEDLPLLTGLYQRVSQGLVARAREVPAERQPAELRPVIQQFQETDREVDRLTDQASPALAAALQPLQAAARRAARTLANLAEADEPWPLPDLPGAQSPPRHLLATLVHQGLRLAEEDDPLRRADYCQDVADHLVRVILHDTFKGDVGSASRLGQPLSQFMDRGVKGNLERLPPDDPRLAELHQVLRRAAKVIQDLEDTLENAPGIRALPAGRLKDLEKTLKEVHKGLKKVAKDPNDSDHDKGKDKKGKDKKGKDKKGKDHKDKGKKTKAPNSSVVEQSPLDRFCNELVGQAFQPDPEHPKSINMGNQGQPGKADLQLRCNAFSPLFTHACFDHRSWCLAERNASIRAGRRRRGRGRSGANRP